MSNLFIIKTLIEMVRSHLINCTLNILLVLKKLHVQSQNTCSYIKEESCKNLKLVNIWN